MASKKKASEPAVRKSFLVIGGSAVGAAVFGFVLFTFVLGGGGGAEGDDQATELATLNNASIPIASAPGVPEPGSDGAVLNALTEGGRDPFEKPAGIVTAESNPGGFNTTTAVAAAAPTPAPAPVYAPAPQPAQTVPVGEGPAPAPAQPAPAQPAPEPQPTPRPVFPQQTITVLEIYGSAADIRIDDTVYEGVRADQVLTERFNLDEFEGSCFYMKDRYPPDSDKPERFKLCADDTVTR